METQQPPQTEIEALSKERTNLEWIKLGIGQLKTIYKAIVLGAVMWGITFIAYNYNPPATQKQIDAINEAIAIQSKKDSIEAITRVVKMEEFNNKIGVTDTKVQFVLEEQKEQKNILLQILSVSKSIKQERTYTFK